MARYWDFRAILDVHPETDKRCVAIKVKSNKRCKITGYTGKDNLGKAVKILDTMDRTEEMVECQTYLLELARSMMCGSPHRTMPDIWKDRVKRWNETIAVYVASISEEEEEEEDVREDISLTPPQWEVEPVGVGNSRLSNSFGFSTGRPQHVVVPDRFELVESSARVREWDEISDETTVNGRSEPSQPSPHVGQITDENLSAPTREGPVDFATLPPSEDLEVDHEEVDVVEAQTELSTPDPVSTTISAVEAEVAQLEDPLPDQHFENEGSVESPENEHPKLSVQIDTAARIPEETLDTSDQISPLESGGVSAVSSLEMSPVISPVESPTENIVYANERFSSSRDSGIGYEIPTDLSVDSPTPDPELVSTEDMSSQVKDDNISMHDDSGYFGNDEIDPPNEPIEENTKPIPLPESEMTIPPPTEQPSDSSEPIQILPESSPLSETPTIITEKNEVISEKRQTRSETREMAEANSEAESPPLPPAKSYGHVLIDSTVRRYPQRFSDLRTTATPQYQSTATEPYRISFDRQEARLLPAINRKDVVNEQKHAKKPQPKDKARTSMVVSTQELQDQIPWENDRGSIKKPKPKRLSLQGVWKNGKSRIRALRTSNSQD